MERSLIRNVTTDVQETPPEMEFVEDLTHLAFILWNVSPFIENAHQINNDHM